MADFWARGSLHGARAGAGLRLDALEEGPFYAVKLMNVIFCTLGGLAVDTQVRVCQQDGVTPINGLYAFGSDSAGNLYNPKQNYTMFPAMAAG